MSAARTASAAIKPMAQSGNANEPVFDVASASERRFVEEATVVETDKTDATKVTNIGLSSSNGKLNFKYEHSTCTTRIVLLISKHKILTEAAIITGAHSSDDPLRTRSARLDTCD